MLILVPRSPRASHEYMPVPENGSRIDPTPVRPNKWGYLAAGREEQRTFLAPDPERESTLHTNNTGVYAGLAFLAALLFG